MDILGRLSLWVPHVLMATNRETMELGVPKKTPHPLRPIHGETISLRCCQLQAGSSPAPLQPGLPFCVGSARREEKTLHLLYAPERRHSLKLQNPLSRPKPNSKCASFSWAWKHSPPLASFLRCLGKSWRGRSAKLVEPLSDPASHNK